MKDQQHKTAICRTALSAPMRWLEANGKLEGDVLDYGCGRGFDLQHAHPEPGGTIRGWDPYWWPVHTVLGLTYDTIVCTYVLNVIKGLDERSDVLARIMQLLNPGGTAYITVRDDKKNLTGEKKGGTWQGKVDLCLDIQHKVSGQYTMYRITKESTWN